VFPAAAGTKIGTSTGAVNRLFLGEEKTMMKVTLLVAIAALVLWVVLLLKLPPSGWLHVPLAVGVILLVRWIALKTA
jgi:uncharacterized membrane protein